MARYVFRLPDVGEGIAEAENAAWHVAGGAGGQEDAPPVDVTTEKARVEIPSPVTGRVVSLAGEPGQVVPIGSELVVLEVAGAAAEAPRPTAVAPPQPA